MSDIDVEISEVGPRDGLQNTKQFMPTEAKKAWISAEAAAGVREIEVCSCVPPKLLPQFVDANEVVAHALAIPNLAVAALIPNLKGTERAAALAEAGADDVSLADTVGYANPAQIKRVFGAVRCEIGEKLTSAHLHNTRGLGLANAVAALECGVKTFDSSLGGLGSCPYAPGASGNIVTEDLVFMLEAMGLRTGIDLEKLLAVRRIIEEALPDAELYSNLAVAGLPKGFARAAAC